MKIYAPGYYSRFKCLADKCENSCCVGWEIDIDEKTLALYQNADGALGEKIRAAVVEEDGVSSFRLDEKERCPFLTECGLCEIICERGEEYLSDICARHPRFYNYLSGRTEIGVGISSEAAAELVLTSDDYSLVPIGEEDRTSVLADFSAVSARDEVIRVLSDSSLGFTNRLASLKKKYGVPHLRDRIEWLEFFSELECLSGDWRELLGAAIADGRSEIAMARAEDEAIASRLAVYFVYRHLAAAADEKDFVSRLGFALLSVELVLDLCYSTGKPIADVARRYSAEIEYSEENTEAVIFEFDYHLTVVDALARTFEV
jgi:lysine-N-methylase